MVLQRYSPPAVLVNDKGDILYISGRTGKYLEPAAGKANWNIFAMAREGLRYELTGAFQKALRQKERVTLHGLKVGTNGGEQFVDVTVQRLEEPGPLQGLVMIVFTDVAAPVAAKAAVRAPEDSRPQRAAGGTGAGTPAGPRRGADHPRRDADLAGGTPVRQRGTAIHQ